LNADAIVPGTDQRVVTVGGDAQAELVTGVEFERRELAESHYCLAAQVAKRLYIYDSDMERWTIKVSVETDRSLRTYLAQRGMKKGAISRFVEEAVEERLYRLTVEEVQARNADVSDDDLQELVDEAVRWARSGR